MTSVSLRRRVAIELTTLAVLTSTYPVLLPERPMWVDVRLGLVAGGSSRRLRADARPGMPPPATPRRERPAAPVARAAANERVDPWDRSGRSTLSSGTLGRRRE